MTLKAEPWSIRLYVSMFKREKEKKNFHAAKTKAIKQCQNENENLEEHI